MTDAVSRKGPSMSTQIFECQVVGETLVVSFRREMQVVSWAILNGGFHSSCSHIINHHVETCSSADGPSRQLRHVSSRLGLRGTVVGMMTAADVRRYGLASASYDDFMVHAVATAGCGNLACVGEEGKYVEPSASEIHAGTINLMVITNHRLTQEAMLEAIQVATEAKVKAMYESGFRSQATQEPATGTGTDCVVVAVGQQRRYRFCGKHTKWGELIGRACLESIRTALRTETAS